METLSLRYFGTDLDTPGHYLWTLVGKTMFGQNLNFKDLPFDPESLPRREPGETKKKGDVRFYNEGGYSILAIEGSCIDDRWGTKSIFFVNKELSKSELIDMILAVPIARLIIDKMPFKINW